MQMNNTKYLPLVMVPLLVAVILSPVLAQTQSEEPTQAQSELVEKAPEQTSPEPVSDAPKTVEIAPDASGTTGKPIRSFKPSEEIGADSAVSFPIDI
jgi:hypothetical protein